MNEQAQGGSSFFKTADFHQMSSKINKTANPVVIWKRQEVLKDEITALKEEVNDLPNQKLNLYIQRRAVNMLTKDKGNKTLKGL